MIKKHAKPIFKGLPDNLQALVLKNNNNFNKNIFRIIAVGDVGFSGRIQKTYGKAQTFGEAFSEVLPFLKTGDQVFCNLETPLFNEPAGMMFAGHSNGAKALKAAGFNIVHLANNHMLDHGVSGLANTLKLMDENGLNPLGAGYTLKEAKSLHIVETNGLRSGWLGCGRTLVKQKSSSPCYWEYDQEEILEVVKESKQKVDFLVLSIHTGLMYLDYPKPETKAFAEKLLENGVDLILMHHAHVLQSVQVHQNGGICCFNLGNFLLDIKEGNVEISIMAREQTESAVFVFDVDQDGIHSAFAVPVYLDDDFVIHWAEGMRGKRILERLIGISEVIKGDYSSLFEQQRVERNTGPMIEVMKFHLRHRNYSYLIKQIGRIRLQHLKMFFKYFTEKL